MQKWPENLALLSISIYSMSGRHFREIFEKYTVQGVVEHKAVARRLVCGFVHLSSRPLLPLLSQPSALLRTEIISDWKK